MQCICHNYHVKCRHINFYYGVSIYQIPSEVFSHFSIGKMQRVLKNSNNTREFGDARALCGIIKIITKKLWSIAWVKTDADLRKTMTNKII